MWGHPTAEQLMLHYPLDSPASALLPRTLLTTLSSPVPSLGLFPLAVMVSGLQNVMPPLMVCSGQFPPIVVLSASCRARTVLRCALLFRCRLLSGLMELVQAPTPLAPMLQIMGGMLSALTVSVRSKQLLDAALFLMLTAPLPSVPRLAIPDPLRMVNMQGMQQQALGKLRTCV